MRIAVLNSGGDCPGLNAVIHGVTCAAAEIGWEVIGFRDGFEGMIRGEGDYMMLTPEETTGILKLGGTILGTTNKGNFAAKLGENDDVARVPKEITDRAKACIDRLGINAVVVIGGDGSLTTAQQLYEDGWPIIGVPKTIDNDLTATAMTFGFDSAVSCVVDGLDRLHTTALSHKRVIVLEVMGRHAGWIALYGGIGGGANAILLPEIPFDINKVADAIKERDSHGHMSTLVVVAEGARDEGGLVLKGENKGGQARLGGIGETVARKLEELTGKETRSCVLGHLQRGGDPTALDRILGARFGVMAVKLASRGEFGRMVSYQSYHVGSVMIKDAVSELRLVNPEGEVVSTGRALGICFGD